MKPKVKKQRKPGGGRHQLIEGVELVKVSLLLTKDQIKYLMDKGIKGNKSDGARQVITRDMAREENT